MTHISAILSLAGALALNACASDNMAWHDTTYNSDPGNRNANVDMNGAHGTLQDNPQVPGNQKSTMMSLTEADRQFVVTALAAGQYEVTAANKVQLRSSDQQVKDIAQHLSEDHMKANSQLTNLASRKGILNQVGLTETQINQLSQLDKLTGTDFDREYLSQQLAAHADAVTLFQSAASAASDRDIRDWASATLPTMQTHLDMVKSLNDSKYGTGANGMSH